MNTPASTKRARNYEEESTHSPSLSPNVTPTTKTLRLTKAETAPLFCSLPPTCNPPHHAETSLANVAELEAHYAKFHAHVCEERGCAAVFPSAKLLELHQTECHDPIAMLRKERGEKIFACHLESCTRKFLEPKKRRLHLIQAHGFPKEYFFAVTNKGVGGLLKKWGEGASMLRSTWKARDDQGDKQGNEDMDAEGAEDADDDDSLDEEMLSTGTVKNITVKPPSTEIGRTGNGDGRRYTELATQPTSAPKVSRTSDRGLDDLMKSMDSLSLVPPSVRFGRGGKSIRGVRQMQAGLNRGRHEQNSKHHPPINATPNEGILPMDAEADAQLSDHISINIDGALEALKLEAPSYISAKTIIQAGSMGSNHVPVPEKRARGGRGRGRGAGRGRGRGRGLASVYRN